MKFTYIRTIMLLILLAAGFIGCEVAGELVDDTHTIELGRAEFADVKLDMGVGELSLQEEPGNSWRLTSGITSTTGNPK